MEKLRYLWDEVLLYHFKKLLSNLPIWELIAPYSEYLLIALLVLVGVGLFLVYQLLLGKKKAARLTGKPQTPREALRVAKEAWKLGDFARAGEYFEQAEKYDQAIEAYGRVRAITRIADVYAKKLNQPEKALEFLTENRLWESAGVLATSLGRLSDAARYYEKGGKAQMASEAFERAGEFQRAAELYKGQNRLPEAARCHEKLEAWPAAAQCHEAIYRGFKQATSARSDRDELSKLQELAKKAAFFFKQAGDLPHAAELLLEVKLPKVAGDLYAQAGQSQKAAELYDQLKEYRLAAEQYHKLGAKKRAGSMMAKHFQQEGNLEEAAKFMIMAEEYLAAADYFAGAERFLRAAELYTKGGDTRTATEMYHQAGRLDLAVELHLKSGDLESALAVAEESGDPALVAQLYERLGKNYEAGLRAQEQNDFDRAIGLFEKVRADHPYFADAQYRLGLLYFGKGQHQAAFEKLIQMSSRWPLSYATMEFYYLLALAAERVGQFSYALHIYNQLVQINPQFKDVYIRWQSVYTHITSQRGGVAATIVAGRGTGQTVAERYKLLQELGRGGMGVVYLAEDTRLERKVAFKLLSEQFQSNPTIIKTFESEAKSMAKLNHPYIVTIYDHGSENGVYYIIMEFVEGRDLKKLIEGGKKLPVHGGLQIFLQLAQALEAAHTSFKHPIIHRDIKPANLMWTNQRLIKVMDFGLATMVDKMREGKMIIAGTPYYMSPEQHLGKNLDHRTDIYSMGVTMYELLTGVVPFVSDTGQDLGSLKMNTDPAPPRSHVPEIPPPLDAVILRCIEKDVNRRYQSAREVYNDLARISPAGGGTA